MEGDSYMNNYDQEVLKEVIDMIEFYMKNLKHVYEKFSRVPKSIQNEEPKRDDELKNFINECDSKENEQRLMNALLDEIIERDDEIKKLTEIMDALECENHQLKDEYEKEIDKLKNKLLFYEVKSKHNRFAHARNYVGV